MILACNHERNLMSFLSFKLSESFISKYENTEPNWGTSIGGGNTLSELVFVSKYSRKKDDGSKEKWFEVCRRCVEGTYSILKDHCLHNKTSWNDAKAQRSAQDAFDRMFNFKWTPPGRGLWTMGTSFVNKERNAAALYNCCFISTDKLSTHSVYEATMPFVRLMTMSMFGVGVGFDTRGAGKLVIQEPLADTYEDFVIPDSREGWAESVGLLLETYFFKNRAAIRFDYNKIRPKGSLLKRFGGTASGPGPLMVLHESIRKQFDGRENDVISSRDIVDLMNKIGKAVVAGGARRSAEAVLGDPFDDDYINIKNWELEENKERTGPDGWAWTSNNSVIASTDMNLSHLIDKMSINGEPGIAYLDNARAFGRMVDEPDFKDDRVMGCNPCFEIFLASYETCNLSELYPTNHDSLEDFYRSAKHAYMFSKAVTLLPTPWAETNEVVGRNRRIGISMTGIAEFVEKNSWHEMQKWMDNTYSYIENMDQVYSEWLGIRESIKLTTCKPSGSTSLIASTSPGVHWPVASGCYVRRVRYAKYDPLVDKLRAAGYHIEDDIDDPNNTCIASFPIKGLDVRSEENVSIWEKAHLASMAQRFWADNAVSVTVSFKEQERSEISPLLNALSHQLKAISFLPIFDEGSAYSQLPYESISEEKFLDMVKDIKKLDDFYSSGLEAVGEKFCSNDHCEI